MNHLDIAEKARMVGDEMRAYVAEMEGRSFRPGSDEDVLRYVRERQIDTIWLCFTDINGSLKMFAITPEELEKAFSQGMGFDGSSIEGYQRIHESDMVAVPIASTARLIPFRIGHARAIRMFLDVRHARTGKPYDDDPRHVLERNLAALREAGLDRMNVGPEAEYFYFDSDREAKPIDAAGYFTLNPVDAGTPLRELTVLALESMGIPVEYHHHEVARSQHEIDLKYADALEMADRLQTHKWLVKELARRCGVHATFMPKPIPGENGSGMHVHISLFAKGKNAFYAKEGRYNLSPMAESFIEGVLQHAHEIVLVTNPDYNSYRRLVPGFEAPVYVAWASDNRSALVRIPENKQGNEQATRAEFRFPDPSCNPYLAFSALLRAGLDGVGRGLKLRAEQKEDLYHLDPIEREARAIESLPPDLYSAIRSAQASPLVATALGPGVAKKLFELKLRENDAYRLTVTPMEIERGMSL